MTIQMVNEAGEPVTVKYALSQYQLLRALMGLRANGTQGANPKCEAADNETMKALSHCETWGDVVLDPAVVSAIHDPEENCIVFEAGEHLRGEELTLAAADVACGDRATDTAFAREHLHRIAFATET